MGGLVARAAAFLRSRGVGEAAANAEFIMADVLGTGRCEVRLDGGRPLGSARRLRFRRLVRDRARRRPLAYVLGHQDFMGFRMEVGPAVLTPRPETEELVGEARRRLAAMDRRPRRRPASPSRRRGLAGGAPRRVLEIGTGSGCIAVALAKLAAAWKVTAFDISARALAVAARNARRHGVAGRVRLVKGDLFRLWGGRGRVRRPGRGFDLVISNPPYVPSRRIPRLAAEVRCEPRLALDGGEDGLDAVRAIVAGAPASLAAGGLLMMEIGHDQGAAVKSLLEGGGFGSVEVLKDMQGFDRIAVGKLA